jgi:2-amino-4-hydroxy-6-hydroxymethyldihydropteridine diphosphokinase
MKKAYLSLGSNMGERRAHLDQALMLLEAPRLQVTRISSCYETEPQGVRDQPWFLNVVTEVETTLFPRMLLNHVLAIERRMGRRRTGLKGPRNIDIDILLYGNFIVHTPSLEIPHPRMTGRRFVLAPLAELAPELRHPRTKKTMRELLAAVQGQVVRRLDPPPC